MLRLSPRGAEILARLFYGMPLPAPTNKDPRKYNGVLICFNALIRRGAIDADNQVTQFGGLLLSPYLKRTKRCPHCLHKKPLHEISAGGSWCKACDAEAKRERMALRKAAA